MSVLQGSDERLPWPCRARLASPLPGGYDLALYFSPQGLASIELLPGGGPYFQHQDEGVARAVHALEVFFQHSSHTPLSLDLHGTPFQQRVWQALCTIPWGETLSYGELARRLGSSPRAVAGACRANPVPLLVPCHRVTAKQGLGGYMGQSSGEGLAIKQWLLRHERHGSG